LLFFDMLSFLVPSSFWPRQPKLRRVERVEPSQGQAWFVVSLLCHPTRSSIVAFCFLDLQLSNTLSKTIPSCCSTQKYGKRINVEKSYF
jgi:hypothetical protein